MLDVGMAEMVVIGGAAILLLGKRDMPLVFRLVGRGVGKISGLIQGGRARMSELSEGNQLLQLQSEIRSNLDDLRVIKAELRGAARLPSGITGTSHPGSTSLRDQSVPSPSPPSPPAYNSLALPQTSLSVEHLGVGRGASATTAAPGFPRASEAYEAAPKVSRKWNHGTEPSAGGSALADGTVSGGSEERAASVTYGKGRVVGDDGFPTEAAARAGTGAGTGARAGPQPAMKSVSPGSDRLQRLAMAEVEFAEKKLYTPKTEVAPGGADILNDTIIESLLQERFRRALQGPRTPGVGAPPDKDGKPSSG